MQLTGATAGVLNQATDALKAKVREAFIEYKIPLNTPYKIMPASDIDNTGKPIKREVWVYQVFPRKRVFKLCDEVLTVVVDGEHVGLQQEITVHDPI